jgi:hypothetical protein
MEYTDRHLGFTDGEVEVLKTALSARASEDENAAITLNAFEVTFAITWKRVKARLEYKYGRAVYDSEIRDEIFRGDAHKMYMTWDEDLLHTLRAALEQLAFYDLDHDTEEIDEQTTRLSREMLFQLVEINSNSNSNED